MKLFQFSNKKKYKFHHLFIPKQVNLQFAKFLKSNQPFIIAIKYFIN